MAIRFGGNLGFNKKIGGINIGVNIPFGSDGHNTTKVGNDLGTKNNTIGRMISHASENNMFSRPNLYRVEITPPNQQVLHSDFDFNKKWTPRLIDSIAFNCDTINIPGQNLSTKPNKTYSLKKEYVYDKIYDTVNATFYVGEGMNEYHFFQDWQKLMFDDRTGDLGWYNNYVGTMIIHQLSRLKKKNGGDDLSTNSSFKLIECYPKTVSPLRLGYSLSNQVQKVDVTFAFRTMTVVSENHEPADINLKSTNPLDKKFSIFRNLNVRGGFKLFGRRQLFNIDKF
tara:strand:- start:911 stop:1759 length:849 start_codon:yes stop_codon:yes gene_type:complete